MDVLTASFASNDLAAAADNLDDQEESDESEKEVAMQDSAETVVED